MERRVAVTICQGGVGAGHEQRLHRLFLLGDHRQVQRSLGYMEGGAVREKLSFFCREAEFKYCRKNHSCPEAGQKVLEVCTDIFQDLIHLSVCLITDFSNVLCYVELGGTSMIPGEVR